MADQKRQEARLRRCSRPWPASASPSPRCSASWRPRSTPRSSGRRPAAVPRPAPAEPAPRRPGEVRRLRAVRLGLPGRRDLRRGRGQRRHRGRTALLAGRALRPRLPDQLPALHLLRPVHRGLPDPRADDDERVRAGRPRAGPQLIFEKQQLLAPMQAGMLAAPHPMVDGLEERDYYQGKVDEATPEQQDWARRAPRDRGGGVRR